MGSYGSTWLILVQDRDIWFRIISGPLLTPKRFIKGEIILQTMNNGFHDCPPKTLPLLMYLDLKSWKRYLYPVTLRSSQSTLNWMFRNRRLLRLALCLPWLRTERPSHMDEQFVTHFGSNSMISLKICPVKESDFCFSEMADLFI